MKSFAFYLEEEGCKWIREAGESEVRAGGEGEANDARLIRKKAESTVKLKTNVLRRSKLC